MTRLPQVLSLFILLTAASAAYNTADANEFASASALAYCDPNTINSWTCGAPCQNLTGYESYFTEVFNVAPGETLSFSMIFKPSSKRFVISFRGTASTAQLLLEILEGDAVNYGLANITNALADDYFYGHYVGTLRPVFTPLIKNARKEYPDYQFIFTGHSLGGALASLAAFDAITSGILPPNEIIMYNYGSPRVGNQPLAQAIQKSLSEVYRVVHWQDMVPHVPPCAQAASGGPCVPSVSDLSDAEDPTSLIWPAWHLEPQVFYTEDNTQYQMCSAEDPNCADQFTLGETNTGDHGYYVGIQMGCSGTSAIGFGPGQENVKIRPRAVNLLTK